MNNATAGNRRNRIRRLAFVPVALAGLGLLAAGPVGADASSKVVQGHMTVSLSTENTCESTHTPPLCMTVQFFGGLHGPGELTALNSAPTPADPNVIVINSKSTCTPRTATSTSATRRSGTRRRTATSSSRASTASWAAPASTQAPRATSRRSVWRSPAATARPSTGAR